MLLTITYHQPPATDLGYLLHKNPSRLHSFELSFGKAHVFYPEATSGRCTAALLLDIDPIGLVRGREGSRDSAGTMEQYVNDRPYVASSFLSVAIARIFGTALGGRSKGRQQLADTPLPLIARISVLPCRGGETVLRELFEPLGYVVRTRRHELDEKFPEWGESPYFTVELEGKVRLSDLLAHIYVLVPVLDAEKHYWVGEAEVEKLFRRGERWLARHPQREMIVRRYLGRQRQLAREALARLAEEDNPDPDATEEAHLDEELRVEEPLRLWQQRLGAVMAVLNASSAKRVLDLGCGEGRLLRALLEDNRYTEIVGMDVSYRSLEIASQRLKLEKLPARRRERIKLMHGSLLYRDKRLEGYDTAVAMEVVEHLDPPRLAAFERVVFEFARPANVAITTPNREYNTRFPTLPAGEFRHKDHRFEWTRQEFHQWAETVAARFGYSLRFLPVGQEDPEVGPPTQMGVFTR